MVFETISEKPFTKQELLNRRLNLAYGKVTTCAELSNIFALFCILATVDLNINPGETSAQLLTIFIVNTSILIVITVLVKIAIMYIMPRLETAIFFSQYDIAEFDQILHDHVISYMEVVYISGSLMSSLLFGANFILISWVKFKAVSLTSAKAATIIMSPVLVVSVLFGIVSYLSFRRRYKRTLLNEDEIFTGSSKVHYSKRIQNNNINSHVANSRWDLIRAHVMDRQNGNKSHTV